MIPGSQYSKAWGKHRIFVELNSSTPASIDSKLDLPSRIMQQWFGVSANAVLNTRWSQINYKIIYPNVMDCANVTKITAPSSAKRYWEALTCKHKISDKIFANYSPYYHIKLASHSSIGKNEDKVGNNKNRHKKVARKKDGKNLQKNPLSPNFGLRACAN